MFYFNKCEEDRAASNTAFIDIIIY